MAIDWNNPDFRDTATMEEIIKIINGKAEDVGVAGVNITLLNNYLKWSSALRDSLYAKLVQLYPYYVSTCPNGFKGCVKVLFSYVGGRYTKTDSILESDAINANYEQYTAYVSGAYVYLYRLISCDVPIINEKAVVTVSGITFTIDLAARTISTSVDILLPEIFLYSVTVLAWEHNDIGVNIEATLCETPSIPVNSSNWLKQMYKIAMSLVYILKSDDGKVTDYAKSSTLSYELSYWTDGWQTYGPDAYMHYYTWGMAFYRRSHHFWKAQDGDPPKPVFEDAYAEGQNYSGQLHVTCTLTATGIYAKKPYHIKGTIFKTSKAGQIGPGGNLEIWCDYTGPDSFGYVPVFSFDFTESGSQSQLYGPNTQSPTPVFPLGDPPGVYEGTNPYWFGTPAPPLPAPTDGGTGWAITALDVPEKWITIATS